MTAASQEYNIVYNQLLCSTGWNRSGVIFYVFTKINLARQNTEDI